LFLDKNIQQIFFLYSLQCFLSNWSLNPHPTL